MNNNQQSPSAFLNNLRIIHLAIFTGLIIFAVLAFFMSHQSGPMLDPGTVEILTYISLIFLLAEIPLAYWLHKNKMKSLAKMPELNSKLTAYRASHIIKIAMLEGVGFFCCVVLLIGGKNTVLIQIAIILIIMLLETPSASKIANELDLPSGDRDLFT
jgi:peptidoglycan/LPS O-acetylase OafA/YrhL